MVLIMPESSVTHIKPAQKAITLTFGKLLEEVLHLHRLNQTELANQTGFSQSYISRIERGVRPLTPKLAAALSQVLTGSAEVWQEIYHDLSKPHDKDMNHFLEKLGIRQSGTPEFGTPILQLQRKDIIALFGRDDIDDVPEDDDDLCEIEGFSEVNVQATSYDLRAGHIALEKDNDGKWIPIACTDRIEVPAGSSMVVGSREHIQLPVWLEAEICPTAFVALEGLMVSHGPIIDPGWGGIPLVRVFNPTTESVFLSPTEPFLTLRFWLTLDAVSPVLSQLRTNFS